MIDNDEQLAIVKDQIRVLEEALDSLEATVRPKSEKQFQLFAEGYIDQLQVLHDDVTAREVSLGSNKAGFFGRLRNLRSRVEGDAHEAHGGAAVTSTSRIAFATAKTH